MILLLLVLPGCASRAESLDRQLRMARLGTPISVLASSLGSVEFYDCEAGSGLYPSWTLRGRSGTIRINLGADGSSDDPLSHLDDFRYTGHFLIKDEVWTSVRWVYTDGLVQDERSRRATRTTITIALIVYGPPPSPTLPGMSRLVLLLPVLLLQACASSGSSPDFSVPTGRYTAAFDAARDTLVAMRFELDRVDAAAGVITTAPKPTAGLATPWDEEQSTFGQEWEDLINDQQHRIRITFEPATPAPAPAPGAPAAQPDLRTTEAPLVGHVQATIDRLHRSSWRLETSSIRYSAQAQDPELIARAMWPSYTVPFAQDPLLAARLADQIQRTLNRPAP